MKPSAGAQFWPMRQIPTAPSRGSVTFTQRMALPAWQSSGSRPTMQAFPLMAHARVALLLPLAGVPADEAGQSTSKR